LWLKRSLYCYKPNLHDDGIDSVCKYASEIILGKGSLFNPEANKMNI